MIVLCATILIMTPAVGFAETVRTQSDFECAVSTAYGEARDTSREEEAIVINMLLLRASQARLSVCEASRRFFAPRPGRTADIVAAAKNVLFGDRSLVPLKFRHATEMRSPHGDPPPRDTFICIGSASQPPANGTKGNLFYELLGSR